MIVQMFNHFIVYLFCAVQTFTRLSYHKKLTNKTVAQRSASQRVKEMHSLTLERKSNAKLTKKKYPASAKESLTNFDYSDSHLLNHISKIKSKSA